MSSEPVRSDSDLIERACDAVAGYLQIGNETFAAAGATFVRNVLTPRRWDANHVADVRCTDAATIDDLFERAETEFAHCAHRRFDVDSRTPPQFVARLALAGYAGTPELHLVLEGELQASPREVDIRPIVDDADWADYERLYVQDLAETRARRAQDEPLDLVAEFMRYKRNKLPDVRYFMAFAEERAVAYFSAWPGTAGVGVVEDLFTAREYRHRGIATALIARCVADARERGAGPVVIGADPTDTPMHMYAALGFRPVFVTTNYVRQGA